MARFFGTAFRGALTLSPGKSSSFLYSVKRTRNPKGVVAMIEQSYHRLSAKQPLNNEEIHLAAIYSLRILSRPHSIVSSVYHNGKRPQSQRECTGRNTFSDIFRIWQMQQCYSATRSNSDCMLDTVYWAHELIPSKMKSKQGLQSRVPSHRC